MAYRRRRSEVLRNLDDPLKVMGLLTPRSCMSLGVIFLAGFSVMLLVGGLGFVNMALLLAFLSVLGSALAVAEKQTDEHHLWAACRYAVSGRWRVLYSGGHRPHRQCQAADLLLADRSRCLRMAS
jgi:hypothetical protein